MLPRRITNAIAVVVAVAWAANVIVGFITPDRHDPALNGPFGIVLGAAFALRRKSTPDTTTGTSAEPENTERNRGEGDA